ncbi:RING finger protein 24-like [Anneissia japonica]|uniref:RING finger protein 24-like n=1 Tax=Anneissia japonica TaxID=1529436 RepID=UPI00142595AD|nr:RING finger protein 24-like [Anneissia japonica]XP_033113392.1 RING finger protein 24-like [Anneissia japonica]XP_033113393.1 RING finger protein 24-like [Anneissia japonica]XP_033113395.1 RING finger protein 24-like [Anneissia japonica]XP_033113396.1 RING finger protein 24-like [Anneissia japonica]XP_033113397.1 RING finger protein 24-like [Anneissia japonica]XP_033113398.1 RING finger protein 24-like [Anneissia japonica]XP_033113399.1 RING finger protein 24-like [Anneissia japonica]
MSFELEVAELVPILLLSGVVIFLNIIFCCYLIRLRHEAQVECGYRKVKFSIRTSPNDSCPVCLEDFTPGEKLGQTPCHHTFHLHCISTWLQQRNTCPICNARPRPVPTERTALVSISQSL